MKRSIASLFWSPEVPRVVNIALWSMLAMMTLGAAVAWFGGYAIGVANPCHAIQVMLGGFMVFGLGPLICGLVLIREWGELKPALRIGAVGFAASGLGLVALMVKALFDYSIKC